jgi:uncharacterized protein (TIGR03083 family)
MADDRHLAGVDPFRAMDREAARIEAHLSGRPDADPEWTRLSRCDGWSVRDVLAHLLSAEPYHAACLAGGVADFIAALAARGATDIASFNALGLVELADQSPSQLLDAWRSRNAETRIGFRQRADGTVDTSVGDYPARWQAFHVASELATHADDMFVPEDDDDREARVAWRAPFSRFALSESKPGLAIDRPMPGQTRVRGDGMDADLDDATFVAAVAGRLDDAALSWLSTAV